MASTQRNPVSFAPLVSVVIPLYNAEADLIDLLSALAAQTYPRDRVEYLLVDNASRDRTAVLLQDAVTAIEPPSSPSFFSLGRRGTTANSQSPSPWGEGFRVRAAVHTSDRLNLRPLSQLEIQSSYAARNVGIQAARGEIVAFTDADCRPQADWLSRLVAAFANRAIGLASGDITALPGKTLYEQYADRKEFLSQRHTLRGSRPYGQTANLGVRREVFEQIGLFRPYLTTGGDADFCWRAQQTDWQLQFIPDAIVQHRHRSSLRDLRAQWQRYGKSNRYLHELHGVELAVELTTRDYLYRCARWIMKELPQAIAQHWQNRTAEWRWAELLDTPLHLVCVQARLQGQRQAQLPPQARWIEPLLTCGTSRVKPPD